MSKNGIRYTDDMGIRSIVVKKFKYHSDKPVSEEKTTLLIETSRLQI